MKTIRPGTHKKIAESLKRHAELMEKYQKEGLSREEASKKAYAEITA